MHANALRSISMDAMPAETISESGRWLWDGFLMPGDLTLLTSQWKTGKTTLLAGLLRCLGTGEPFLNRPTRPSRAWVLSEESESHWAERLRRMPIGPHAQLFSRPFRGRPTPEDWSDLIDRAVEEAAAGRLDLVVVDPLASFLPGRCESDAATLLEALTPLHRLTAAGMAVLLLHHPRKKKSEAGSSARGSGALLGFVDTSIELTRYGPLNSDACRRLLLTQSRRGDAPGRLAYEWNPATGAFAETADPRERQFEENWKTVLGILEQHTAALTHKELAECWPDDAAKPAMSTLYSWLNLAAARKLVRREGQGTKSDPWGYRLKNKDDKYRDLGELPPLEPLW